MFLARRPSQREIEKFIARSRDLPLSYNPIGIAKESPHGFKVDEASGTIGRGESAFERAKVALSEWRHFDFGWVELFPRERRNRTGKCGGGFGSSYGILVAEWVSGRLHPG